MKPKRAFVHISNNGPTRNSTGGRGKGKRSLLPPPLSPNRQLFLVAGWIFFAELINMLLLSQMPFHSHLAEAIVDSSFLLITLSPIYFLLFRPFKLQWDETLLLEKKLIKNEERLELALEATNVGLWDYNVQTSEVYYSPRWATMLGYTPAEIEPTFQSWKTLLHPDEKDQVIGTLNNHLEGRTPYYEAEVRMRSKAGEWVWILTRGRVVAYDGQGKPLRVVGTHTDITARKQAEEDIRYLSRQLLNVTEEERAHLARDLHDEFGQVLVALQFGMETLKNALPEEQKKNRFQCQRQIELVAQLGNQVRNISATLRPAMLDDMGLEAALRYHVEQFSRQMGGIDVDFLVSGPEGRLSRETGIVLYRICQEGLNNIAKHSKAKHVSIRLTRLSAQVILTIQDDGVGFEPKSYGHRGIGLLGMRERAASRGGRLSINSPKGQGTTIRVELPVSEERTE